jgi:BirA family biotin operon repressor/biotin-[acetyl-CoA-carboxylase] ligase
MTASIPDQVDPARAPLDRVRLRAAFPGRLDVRVVGEADSTNVELAAAARAGAADGTVLAAERQRAGRGRLGRRWHSPPGSGLTFSWLLRPSVPATSLGWLPLFAGAAVARALRSRADVAAVLKWPNDVIVEGPGGGKVAGILVELVPESGRPPAAVVGIGLNVSPAAGELPPGSTSVQACGGGPGTPALDRTDLLVAVLGELLAARAAWEADPATTRDDYVRLCATVGQPVRVFLPDGSVVEGTATAVDADGHLVVGGQPFSAADIVHLRAAPQIA